MSDVSRETSDRATEAVTGALNSAGATVESEIDPARAGRTAYRISGPSREAVQAEIARLTDDVDERGGFANFIGPALRGGKFWALGEVVIRQRVPA